jgi:hypothetical protein
MRAPDTAKAVEVQRDFTDTGLASAAIGFDAAKLAKHGNPIAALWGGGGVPINSGL